jgi:hypothetical protein
MSCINPGKYILARFCKNKTNHTLQREMARERCGRKNAGCFLLQRTWGGKGLGRQEGWREEEAGLFLCSPFCQWAGLTEPVSLLFL